MCPISFNHLLSQQFTGADNYSFTWFKILNQMLPIRVHFHAWTAE